VSDHGVQAASSSFIGMSYSFAHRYYVPTVSLQSFDRFTGKRKHVCSGTLISRQVVLTAAHCIFPSSIEDMVVTVGVGSFLTDSADKIFKKSSIAHPGFQYEQLASRNDLGLVFLETCVTGDVQFPLLTATSSPKERACAKVVTYGYGRHEIIPPHLFVADGSLRSLGGSQRFHSDQICRDAYTIYTVKTLYGTGPISETVRSQIAGAITPTIGCYGGDHSAQTEGFPCQGDSGGPVFDADFNTLVGVTSFSSDVCGTLPNYYTRVSSFASWIAREIQKKNLTCDSDNDLRYLAGGSRSLIQTAGQPFADILERSLLAASVTCKPLLELLNTALESPTVPLGDIQSSCTAFLACLEEAAETAIIDIMDAILSMFPADVEEIDAPMAKKIFISRILLCSSTYEDYYESWHEEADITFNYMELPHAKEECVSRK
jgi:hypothetical protein